MSAYETDAAREIASREVALSLQGISSGYGDTIVLRNVSLTVPKSSVVALLGPNGAGKTTLLKTVSGLIRPNSGHIELNGKDVTKVSPNRRARMGLCHIPEGRGIFRSLTVRDNLLLQSLKGQEGSAIEQAVSVFPVLESRLRQQAGTLSGGQQQMLAMAQAYVSNPSLILVDEASLGLAPVIVDEIFNFLHEVAQRGAALLIVDQYIVRALDIATTAYVLRRGEIVYSGDPDELRASNIFERYLGVA
jgi:branched-chain amino acid transport system ATP-binding protein